MRFCVKAGRFLNIGLAKAKAAQLIEILLKLWYGQVQYLKSRSCNFLKVKNVKKKQHYRRDVLWRCPDQQISFSLWKKNMFL